jgi:hypothetical protein
MTPVCQTNITFVKWVTEKIKSAFILKLIAKSAKVCINCIVDSFPMPLKFIFY